MRGGATACRKTDYARWLLPLLICAGASSQATAAFDPHHGTDREQARSYTNRDARLVRSQADPRLAATAIACSVQQRTLRNFEFAEPAKA
jgi:hypothetical protein